MMSEPQRIVYDPKIQKMERWIKERGLWSQYKQALLGFPSDSLVPIEREVLLGYSFDRRRNAIRSVLRELKHDRTA